MAVLPTRTSAAASSATGHYGAHLRGFTLVELLIVVGIITVLLALLMPAVRRARESAQRAACASNLRQLAAGVHAYAIDNDGQIPQSVSQWGGRYGILIRQRAGHSAYSNLSDEISLTGMARYLGGVNVTHPDVVQRYVGVWWCPSNGQPSDFESHNALLSHHWTSFDYTFFTYSYFGRVNEFPTFVTRPLELTHNRLAGDRLLFADATYNGAGPGLSQAWLYNHGRQGPAGLDYRPINQLAGTNNAYGDGHVEWKDASAFDIPRMAAAAWDPAIPMMQGNGNYTYW